MAEISDPITVLDEDHCWDLLAGAQVGRLATAVDGIPEIFPVNYAVYGTSVVFRSAEGSKLLEIVLNDQVAFEADGWTDDGGWSVICRGTASVVDASDELGRVEALPLKPWIPTVKTNFVRVQVSSISGRRFRFGPDPVERYRYGHNKIL